MKTITVPIVVQDDFVFTGDEIVDVVFQTSDYSKFKFLDQNREIDRRRATAIAESMSEKTIKTEVLVNEDFGVIDGQHTITALMELGKPIRYVVQPGADIYDCRRLNEFNKAWKRIDWIESWSKSEDKEKAENYQLFLETMNEFAGLKVNLIARLAGKSVSWKGTIREGGFIFTKHDQEVVRSIVAKGREIISALCFDGRLNESFWIAVKIMCETEGYSHERMIENCKQNRSSYNQMSSCEAQLTEFSRIYNYRRRKNQLLHFERYMENKGYNIRNYSNSANNLKGK